VTVPTKAGASGWLKCFRPGPPGARRIIVFPHAGGGASFYRALGDRFPADVDVRVVQYPGREGRIAEPLVDTMDVLADRAAEAVAPYLDRPTAILGHSMGGSVAYEVVRRLEAAGGRLPERLFVSARSAPMSMPPTSVHRLDDAGFSEMLRLIGGTPQALLDSKELWEYLLPIVRNDYRLIETYRPATGPKLRTGIVAIEADGDLATTPEGIRAWSAFTDGGFDRAEFPGGHFYLLEHADALVATVLRHLIWT
jgi:pyochelin biosynthetic protein PchC